jgi:hypothetical protein
MPILRKSATIFATAIIVILACSDSYGEHNQDRGIPNQPHRIINITDDFLAFWEKSKGKSLKRQRRTFVKQVEAKYPEYFEKAVYRGADDITRREMLDEFLLRVPWEASAIKEFNETAVELVSQTLMDFQSRYPEYRQKADIYIGPSLYGFDGSVRPVNGEDGIPDTLCLGSEVLASYTAEQVQIVIAHEFFHLYHFDFLFRDTATGLEDAKRAQFRTAHMPLMIEGMAVAGVETLYPYRRASAYLHFSEDELVAQEEFLWLSSRRYLRLIGEQALPEKYQEWFTSFPPEGVPSRGGYLLGYEVAKRVLATYTIEQMIRLSPAQLREHAEEQLLALTTEQVLLLASD